MTALRIGLWCTLLTLAGVAPAADVFNGERLYGTLCAGCHGSNGQGVLPGAPNFARGQRLMRTDRELVSSLRNGRNAMPAYLGVLDEAQMYDVIAYLRTLR